jgi:hypothetical protein
MPAKNNRCRISFNKKTICWLVAFAASLAGQPRANAAESSDEKPLASAVGVSRDDLVAFATAHARVTLSDFLDVSRPGIENDDRLKRLIERAQTAWLSKSVEQARLAFHEITRLSLEADWRESQREVLHYSHLRMAQMANLPTEREEWLNKAATLFPDIKPDSSLFPPPLISEYEAKLKAVQMSTVEVEPARSFPQYRYILVNGRRFEITDGLRIALNSGIYRITAYSDSLPPISEPLSASQLDMFQANPQAIARGSCEMPESARLPSGLGTEVTFLFPDGCLKSLSAAGWQKESAIPSALDLKPAPHKSDAGQLPFGDPTEKVASDSRHSWMLVAGAALAAGVVAAIAESNHQSSGSAQTVHRSGF